MHVPTVEEYAQMSWHARQELTKRLRRQLNDKARRAQLKADARITATAVRREAAQILAQLPIEPLHLTAARRAIWENK